MSRILGVARERISNQSLTGGVSEWKVRTLAHAAGLRIWGPKRATVELICEPRNRKGQPAIWLARTDLLRPVKIHPTFADLHYVLILEGDDRTVVFADPHPRHAPVQAMATWDCEAAWTAARGAEKPRWLSLLYR